MRSVNWKATFAMLLLGLVLAPYSAFGGSGTWATITPMLLGKCMAVAGAMNGQIYVVGGAVAAGGATTEMEAFNPLTGSWTVKASAPTPRSIAGGAVINGKFYVVGGCFWSDCRIGLTNILEMYDPDTDVWTTKEPMPTALNSMATGVIDNKLYVVGGMQECAPCTPMNILQMYDPVTNTWQTKSPMPTPRINPKAGVMNGKLYVAGGYVNGIPVNTLEVYDPATDSWTTKATMPTGRILAGFEPVNNLLYATGESYVLNPADITYVYNPLSDSWSFEPANPLPTNMSAVATLNGSIYVAGGYSNDGGGWATVETFTPFYTLNGFLPPANNLPTVNTGKAGRTYPIKWQMKDANDNYVTNLNVLKSVTYKSTSCEEFTSDPSESIDSASAGGTELRYDSTANSFVYNWKSPEIPGCYTLFVTFDNGQTIPGNFSLK